MKKEDLQSLSHYPSEWRLQTGYRQPVWRLDTSAWISFEILNTQWLMEAAITDRLPVRFIADQCLEYLI